MRKSRTKYITKLYRFAKGTVSLTSKGEVVSRQYRYVYLGGVYYKVPVY